MGQPLILPVWKFFDAAGLPLAGGKLYSYAAGTTTPQATYTDTTEGTPNTNPLILDANGVGVIWLGSLNYKFILKDSLDNILWTADGIQSIPNGSITTVKLADGSVTTVKLADGAVTTVKILDANVTTAKIADSNVTTAKIADGAVTFAKLSASTEIGFVEMGGPRDGDGPTAFPRKPWTTPTIIANPASPAVGDGSGVSWSPNGKVLLVAENNSEGFAFFERLGSDLVRMSQNTDSVVNSTSAAVCAAWSPDSEYAFIGSATTSYWLIQKSGYGFAELVISNPGLTTVGAYYGADWCPNGKYLAIAGGVSPYITLVKRFDVNKNHIIARYNSSAGQSIGNTATTTVNFGTKEEDNALSVVTGASWQFTARRTNTYRIEARTQFATNTSAGTVCFMQLLHGVSFKIMDKVREGTIGALIPGVGGSVTISMIASETCNVQVWQNSGGATTLDTGPENVWITVTEEPGFNKLSTFSELSAPATIPTGTGKCVKWSPDGQFVAVGHDNVKFTFRVTAANATATAVYNDSNGHSYFVFATIVGATTLVMTSNTTPATVPAASGTLTKVSGTGDATITYSSVDSPVYVTIYQRTGDTLAKCADPATMPTGQVNGISWSPDGLKLTCVHAVTPFITTYSRPSTSSATFTKIANPATLPAGTGNGCAYNSIGDKLAVAHNTSPFVTIYSVSGSTFTKDTDPASGLPAGTGKSVSWTPDSQYLTVGHVTSPYMTTYRTTGTTTANAVTYIKEVDLV